MDEMQRLIHTSEFAVHLALHAAAPVWQALFGCEVPPDQIGALQQRITEGEGALASEEVEALARQYLGEDAVHWMWRHFISTAEPRAQVQQAVLMIAVRPTVAPLDDPQATAALAGALSAERLLSLEALEALMADIAASPGHPEDEAFATALGALISPVIPVQRLIDSIYVATFEPVVIDLMRAA